MGLKSVETREAERIVARGAAMRENFCPVTGCTELKVAEYRMCVGHWHRVSIRTRELIHRARVNYWRQSNAANKKHLETVYGKALTEALAEAAARLNAVP